MDKMREGMNSKLNNKGLSLVELIVAISIGVIVSGSIAALITFSIRTYRNESVNTSLQYELQSNINMMMDEIMGASVFVIKQNSPAPAITDPPADAPGVPYTKYALFGNIYTPLGSSDKKIKGVIFVSDDTPVDGKFKIYMDRFDVEFPGSYTNLNDFAEGMSGISGVNYLLGENLTQFLIQPTSGLSVSAPYEYTNPINVRVKLSFERNGWGSKIIKKHVDDEAYLRNKVTDTIYVDDNPYSLKKKDE